VKITVVGTGYVGLVAGACLADSGQDVTCVDKIVEKIQILRDGGLPIYEPGLRDIVARGVRSSRLRFSTELDSAVAGAEVIFICVGTPPGPDGQANLEYVYAAAEEIGRALIAPATIVMKSTVPVGTADEVRKRVAAGSEYEFEVVSNPEFLKEGAAIDDFTKPDRVVIGTSSENAATIMREIYSPFLRTDNPMIVMDNRSAELTKYAANALLATKISFINDMANLAELVGADIEQVRRGIGTDSRIGFQFLFPGVGYGGSCFPKDVEAIIDVGKARGHELRILRAVQEVNQDQKRTMADKVIRRFPDLKGRTIALWGLAFKPGTDDMRESPAIVIAETLMAAGAKIRAYDPEARETARQVFGDRIEIVDHEFEALEGATALVIVTEWKPFRRPDLRRIHEMLLEPVIFDGRNLFDPDKMARRGFEYFAVGRGLSVRSDA